MNKEAVLFALIRSVICGETVNQEIKAACTPELLENVYTLASKHDLVHLVGQAVSKLDLPESEALTKCKQTAMRAFVRYMQQNNEYTQVCQVLEEANIPYIPLKGSVLRDYYPEPWMRTSCDADILVKEDILDTATELLIQKLGYRSGSKSDHDISLYAPSGVHLELHYDTIQERYEVNGCREVLAKIWNHAAPREQDSCHLWLTDEMFYFYHMAHMAKHFEVGGCGVRAFLDIWIMNHKMSYDKGKRHALLKEGGLLQFAQAAEKVSECWFSNAKPEEMDVTISDYILRASLYGDKANRAALGQAKNGGKLKYLLTQRVFMPYAYLKDEYPILKQKKWLTPAYQVVRWIRMLRSKGGLGNSVKELKANAVSGKENAASAAEILKHLGL
ncbi:MAG: nucleotidyltransferase family protein [Oscillospiraceae bacterium]|nr:nucleotidyltransferase family protein [Oscillospiraceae bacterium]